MFWALLNGKVDTEGLVVHRRARRHRDAEPPRRAAAVPSASTSSPCRSRNTRASRATTCSCRTACPSGAATARSSSPKDNGGTARCRSPASGSASRASARRRTSCSACSFRSSSPSSSRSRRTRARSRSCAPATIDAALLIHEGRLFYEREGHGEGRRHRRRLGRARPAGSRFRSAATRSGAISAPSSSNASRASVASVDPLGGRARRRGHARAPRCRDARRCRPRQGIARSLPRDVRERRTRSMRPPTCGARSTCCSSAGAPPGSCPTTPAPTSRPDADDRLLRRRRGRRDLLAASTRAAGDRASMRSSGSPTTCPPACRPASSRPSGSVFDAVVAQFPALFFRTVVRPLPCPRHDRCSVAGRAPRARRHGRPRRSVCAPGAARRCRLLWVLGASPERCVTSPLRPPPRTERFASSHVRCALFVAAGPAVACGADERDRSQTVSKGANRARGPASMPAYAMTPSSLHRGA